MKPLRKQHRPGATPAPGTPGRRMPSAGDIRKTWNQGGTLHAATFAEWHSRGTFADGLATCADWVAATRKNHPRNNIRYTTGDEALQYAYNLLTAINAATAAHVDAWPDGSMADVAMQAMALMGWIRPDGVLPGQDTADPVAQLQAEVRYLRREMEKMKREDAGHVSIPA